MANSTASSDAIISLPKGGGALHGIGEKFVPDLHTGTGNFTVPIATPPGRNGFQPQLNLAYSTGGGSGFFGHGWGLSIAGVSRRTSKGVPQYNDADVFTLSGADDLVKIGSHGNRTRYRPRTESGFALIERVFNPVRGDDYWEVRSKDGLISVYGTPGLLGKRDPRAIGKDADTKFAWKLNEARDPFDNRIVYAYSADEGSDGPHQWKQPRLLQIEYGEFDDPTDPRFLISVFFEYEDQPEPYSDYRSGFEIRTTKRCTAINVRTHFDAERQVRRYQLTYRDDAANSMSLLSRIEVIGFDDSGDPIAELPPLTFDYTGFDPVNAARRDLIALKGRDRPARSLSGPNCELVDLDGNGLPDVLEMNGVVRYWRNLGYGQFDLPRPMDEAPPLRLADPGVQILDADGDGRADLVVTAHPVAGYYTLNFDGEWGRQPQRRYRQAPSFSFDDPEVKLLDLDGDEVTDVLRSGTQFECFFHDPVEGWSHDRIALRPRRQAEDFSVRPETAPDVNFSDPRVKLADLTGDGLQDIVLVHNGRIDYWPNLGHGRWGHRITMRDCPRFHDPAYSLGYDPKRVLIGDLDGDGLADMVYIADGRIHLWINRGGNRWNAEIVIEGTPRVSDFDAVRTRRHAGVGRQRHLVDRRCQWGCPRSLLFPGPHRWH